MLSGERRRRERASRGIREEEEEVLALRLPKEPPKELAQLFRRY
jgi:hypothetical protein